MTRVHHPPRPTALARLRRRALELLGRRRRSVTAREYAESVPGGRYFHRTLKPATVGRAPLPRNVARRDELPTLRDPWGFSFHDVPERRVEPRSVARLPRCRLVPYRNRWGSEYHTVLAGGGRALRLRRMGPPGNEELTPVDGSPPVDVGEAAWIVGRWHRNYYHWLVYHLPQALVLQELGVVERMLVPRAGRLSAVMADSLGALGVESAGLRPVPVGPFEADPLWIVESDRFDPDLLRALRRRLAPPGEPADRRVYLSRARAQKRRLAGGGALARLEGAGFEVVEAEGLSFREQAGLAARTRVLVGVHGAGLANMIFMPEGAHVIELAHPWYPSPAFYALASALGLQYWLVWGTPEESRGPAALDVLVDGHVLDHVVGAIEAQG